MSVEIITETITYEQPLNEPMRICLRLEYLFKQIKQHCKRDDADSSKLAVSAIVKTLDVINRPDLKSKLAQTLTQHAKTLSQLKAFPQVDPKRLQNILRQLNELITNFNQQQQRVGERLRDNEFLNQIRLRQSAPGGACTYSTPAYALWVKKPANQRREDLEVWFSEFSELRQIVDLTLFLTRNSSDAKTVIAQGGFFQQNLDASQRCEIIRVKVPTDYNVFPEFSVGPHRLAIRFLQPTYQEDGRPVQVHKDIKFELCCCRV